MNYAFIIQELELDILHSYYSDIKNYLSAMFRVFVFVIGLLLCNVSFARPIRIKRVLFIGNSYTYVNNLPQMLSDLARAQGDSCFVGSNTIGGYTLEAHSTNAVTLSLISSGNWDVVVLQDQSQRPAFPPSQTAVEVFPFARRLDSLIKVANPCTKTMFYMTWGRKNGDSSNCSSWPPICTYNGMDSLLRQTYTALADSNKAEICPVGPVRHALRSLKPALELYQSDESHPSLEGTYAAACTFYAAIFRSSLKQLRFTAGIDSNDAALIRSTVDSIVTDSLAQWYIGKYDSKADFSIGQLPGSPQVTMNNYSTNATNYVWAFGDGDTSHAYAPTHTYRVGGFYTIQLIASRCGISDTMWQSTSITVPTSASQNNIVKTVVFRTVDGSYRLQLQHRASLSLLDMSGKLCYRTQLSEGEHILRLQSLVAAGSYLLILDEGASISSQRISIEE
jgi:hypothetical protein